ncbi:MAG: ABC transporter permease, partial [Bacteroidota bacterium]|nr:ABC transporter permease [Bacteroidota bacterium]
MRTLFYLLQKEFIQIFRNKTMLPIIFLVPLLQMLILVYAATFDVKKINLYIVDKDLSSTSRQMVSKLGGSPFFTITDCSFSLQEGEEAIMKDKTDMVIHIPRNFERNLMREEHNNVQLLVNAINSTKAELAFNYASMVIRNYNNHIITSWKGIPDFKPLNSVEIDDSYWFNPELNYKFYMAPGILAILVTIIGMFLSGMNLVREKEIGTIEQLNVTPIRKYQFIVGKLVPFLFIALFDLAFGLLIAKVTFSLPIVGSLGLLFSFAAIYLIGILGLGLLIS